MADEADGEDGEEVGAARAKPAAAATAPRAPKPMHIGGSASGSGKYRPGRGVSKSRRAATPMVEALKEFEERQAAREDAREKAAAAERAAQRAHEVEMAKACHPQ